MTEEVECKACGFKANVSEYAPCLGVYNDIRCPKCGSTHNEHNRDYQRRMSHAMRS